MFKIWKDENRLAAQVWRRGEVCTEYLQLLYTRAASAGTPNTIPLQKYSKNTVRWSTP